MPDNARAASGHAATAPLSAASISRRPMVTVIRPSRARCVKAMIPRHERGVLTARHPARRLALPVVIRDALATQDKCEYRHRCDQQEREYDGPYQRRKRGRLFVMICH
jgi:hypothetical protein